MPIVISFLRGINLAGQRTIKMEALRALYDSIGLKNAQTHLQSGNVVFRAEERELPRLAAKVETAIERKFGFRAGVILRTSAELRGVIARNPFAGCRDVQPSKLVTMFLPADPEPRIHDQILQMQTSPEEVHLRGREVYIYFPEGMGRSKLWPRLDKILKNMGTARNWNTVTKLVEIAQSLERQK
jgi:uncharacterized protein (DUF1697 family)